MAVEKVPSGIPSHAFAGCGVVIGENVGPGVSAGCLRRFPYPALRAKQNIAAAVKSNAVNVAVANAVCRIHVSVRRRSLGPRKTVISGAKDTHLLGAQPQVASDGIKGKGINASAHVGGGREAGPALSAILG